MECKLQWRSRRSERDTLRMCFNHMYFYFFLKFSCVFSIQLAFKQEGFLTLNGHTSAKFHNGHTGCAAPQRL